jgi:hypothetical protein
MQHRAIFGGRLKRENPLTAKVAKVFRKGRKVLFISTIILRSLRFYRPELYLTPEAFAKEVA